MLFDAFVVETAVWVFATVVISLCVTRVYLNSLFGLASGKSCESASPMRKPKGKAPFVTVMLPTYNENGVVDRLLGAATKLDYPNYEILVVDDSTDRKAIERLERWRRNSKVTIVHRDLREGFKAGAMNNALKRCDRRSEYLLLFDADYVPQPDIIWRFMERFDDYGVDAVQGYPEPSLNSSKNLFTMSVGTSFSYYYLVDLPMRRRLGGFIPLGGSVFMMRKGVIDELGGFDESSITEDWELSSRMAETGHKVIFDESIRVPAECPSSYLSLVRQQMRWAEGITRDTKNHLLRMMASKEPTRMEKFDYAFYGFSYFNCILGTITYALSFLAFLISNRVLIVLGVDTGLILGLGALGNFLIYAAPVYLSLVFVFAALVGLYRNKKLGSFYRVVPFVLVNMSLTPFIAFSSIKGLLFKRGSWSRTPKTGEVTSNQAI
jgi:cellulose synthase/poly-beta-1,6-N-acetylglucosamine synthase-like glycosyltransferase